MTTPFKITGEAIELAKLLKITGLCESGGQAKYVIQGNLVKVNGAIETHKAFKVTPGMTVEFRGQQIEITK